MAQFIVLSSNEKLMNRLRIFTNRLNDPINEFFTSITTFYFAFNIMVFIVTSGVFVYENRSNLIVALRTAMVVIGCSQALGMFFSVGINMPKVKALHLKLQKIVNETAQGIIISNFGCNRYTSVLFEFPLKFTEFVSIRNNFHLDGENDVSKLYWKTELKCRRVVKMMLYYIYFHQWTFITAILYALFNIGTGNFDTSTWNLPLNLIAPFNTQSVWGWLLKWFFEFSSGLSYALCNIMTTSYFICFCLYIGAICNHFSMLMDSARHNVRQNQKDHCQNHHEIWLTVHSKLTQCINLHDNVLE